MSPYALGYGPFIKFDHDFIGREALEKMQEQAAAKESDVRLELEDVLKVIASMFEPGDIYKYIDLPLSNYASASYDKSDERRKDRRLLDVQRL